MFAEPTFVGIGAQKCGSSSVADYLRDLGAVIPKKELHYFTYYRSKREEYLSLFPRVPPGTAVGEFTPDYLYSTNTVHLLSSFLTATRFIVVLRNPIDRFYSAANHGRGIGRIPSSWSAQRILDSVVRGSNNEHWNRTLVWKGFYGEHVERLFRLVPLARVGVYFLEELIDPEQGAERRQSLIDFVGLKKKENARTFPQANRARKHLGVRRSLVRDPGVDDQLRTMFRPSVSLLESVIARRVPWDI